MTGFYILFGTLTVLIALWMVVGIESILLLTVYDIINFKIKVSVYVRENAEDLIRAMFCGVFTFKTVWDLIRSEIEYDVKKCKEKGLIWML